MRQHFPLAFPSKQAAESYLASVQLEQPDARLVNLAALAGGPPVSRPSGPSAGSEDLGEMGRQRVGFPDDSSTPEVLPEGIDGR